MTPDTKAFSEKAGFAVRESEYIQTALTHASWAYENSAPASRNNERLEFLGDAVLQLSVSVALYRITPELPEGKMTKIRALLVCEETLADLARSLNLGAYLRLGHGEELTGGREKNSNLANAMEAVIGSIFLDQGYTYAEEWVTQKLSPFISLALRGKLVYDFKSVLLERAQAAHPVLPVSFQIIDEQGPIHERIFTSELTVGGEVIASGQGKNKKEAEQEAAARGLEWFDQIHGSEGAL